jgi:hypothetical protein
MMKTWTLQKGFPLVTVQRKGTELLLQQERFFLRMQPESQPSDTRYHPLFFPACLLSTFGYKNLGVLFHPSRENRWGLPSLEGAWKVSVSSYCLKPCLHIRKRANLQSFSSAATFGIFQYPMSLMEETIQNIDQFHYWTRNQVWL